MMCRGALSLLLTLMISSGLASEITVHKDSLQRSIDYINQLDVGCTLTDGYVCADVEEDSFMQPESWQRMTPAAYMQAWQIAYEDFQQISDLTQEQKNLRHYKVGFTENDAQYIIVLLGLALPYIDKQGKPDGIVNAVFGRSTKYWIDKDSKQIVKRLFYK